VDVKGGQEGFQEEHDPVVGPFSERPGYWHEINAELVCIQHFMPALLGDDDGCSFRVCGLQLCIDRNAAESAQIFL
jgi:hypothetical protein